MKITYHSGSKNNLNDIAELHARSWKKFYRGSLSDHYLDQEVVADRLEVWTQRFNDPKDSQQVYVAKLAQKIIGFICVYLNHDPQWGALIDNLHVDQEWQGRGVGKKLLNLAFQKVAEKDPPSKYYLWVLSKNSQAIAFYLKCGGTQRETKIIDNLGGETCEAIRITWEDVSSLK